MKTVESDAALPGRASITISRERRQLLGVRTEVIREAAVVREIRTVGRVSLDERRLYHVHAKVEGYVEKLDANYMGQYVSRGQRLLAIYSPELVATQQEFLLAYRAREELRASSVPSLASAGRDLLEATRQRLLLWDIAPKDIDELERSGEIRRTLDLHAEFGGYVVGKSVFEGMRVTPADTLITIADLSRVWVLAVVYESDSASVHLGSTARVSLPYEPGKVWKGQVTWISPTVDPETRTIEVRIELANEGGELKPEMFVDIVLFFDEGRSLVVPDTAVITSGQRILVFVDIGDGRLAPREVILGKKSGDVYPVLRGLEAGEHVVTSANFLIDSESSLKAAIDAMTAGATEHRH